MKTFVKGTYNHGDYVFAPSSKDPTHDSMYIAEGTFTALKAPSKELDKKHWVEFKAPQGEKGQPGTPGTNGKDGRDGHDGTGLTLKTFVKDHTYHHGDYVFAPSSKDPTHDSMYIAEVYI